MAVLLPAKYVGYPTGKTLYLYPTNAPISNFAAVDSLRVAFPETEAELYAANIDALISLQWVAFDATGQASEWVPAWSDAILDASWDFTEEWNRSLAEADEVIEERAGVYVRAIYARGTSTELLPIKGAEQPGGAPLTNPVTQQLAGFRE